MTNQTVSCNDCNQKRADEEFYAFEERTEKRPEHVAKPHPQKARLKRATVKKAAAEGWRWR